MIRIVLVETSHPGNIGAAARAMKTMGLSQLALVNPASFPSAEATARAAGADDILANARVCTSVAEAVDDCGLVLATSARIRRIGQPLLTPEQTAERALQESAQHPVAILFGRERSGLTNEEMALAHALVHIDTEESFSSLNLASAVQILAYELRRLQRQGVATAKLSEDDEPPASGERMQGLFDHMQEALLEIRYLHPEKPHTLMMRLQRLFKRARPSDTEVNILRGMLSAAQKAARRE